MSADNEKPEENFQMPPVFGGSVGPDLGPDPSSYVDANQNPLAAFAMSQTSSQVNSIKQAILRSIFQLTEFRTTSGSAGSPASSPVDSLVSNYNDLLARVSAYNPGANNAATTTATLSAFRKELADLDGKKAEFIAGGKGFIGTAKEAAHFYISHMLYIFGPIFAIVLVTNTFYQLKRVPPDSFALNALHKVFYAFWAAIWYPVVLLYGVFDPPVYRAFFPLVPGVTGGLAGPLKWSPFEYEPPSSNAAQSEWNKSIMRFISGGLFVCFLYVYIFYDDMV
jgi:hypothetical protein